MINNKNYYTYIFKDKDASRDGENYLIVSSYLTYEQVEQTVREVWELDGYTWEDLLSALEKKDKYLEYSGDFTEIDF